MTENRNFHDSFTEWAALARENPNAFEALRAARVRGVIERAPAARRRRLEALQWRIDQECTRAATPLEAARRLSGMMWDSLLGSGGFLESLRGSCRRPPPGSAVPGTEIDKVVELHPRRP